MKKDTELAQEYIKIMGGKENITSLEACITRIRVLLKDIKNIKDEEFLHLGAMKVIHRQEKELHIVVGVSAERLVSEMEKQLVD